MVLTAWNLKVHTQPEGAQSSKKADDGDDDGKIVLGKF